MPSPVVWHGVVTGVCHVLPCRVMPLPCHAMPCHAMPRHATPRHATPNTRGPASRYFLFCVRSRRRLAARTNAAKATRQMRHHRYDTIKAVSLYTSLPHLEPRHANLPPLPAPAHSTPPYHISDHTSSHHATPHQTCYRYYTYHCSYTSYGFAGASSRGERNSQRGCELGRCMRDTLYLLYSLLTTLLRCWSDAH